MSKKVRSHKKFGKYGRAMVVGGGGGTGDAGRVGRPGADPSINYHEIARQVGVYPSYIHRLLNGGRGNPSLNIATRLAKVMGLSVEELQVRLEAARKQRAVEPKI